MCLNFKSSIFVILFIFISVLQAQSLPSFELNSEWTASIESMVNSQKKLTLKKKKKLLIFSLHTGFEHWTIPHTEAVMEIIAQNSEVFEINLSKSTNKELRRNLYNGFAKAGVGREVVMVAKKS